MTQRWTIGRAGVALVAAYALALQALLASFVVGAMVGRHEVAGITGVLCVASRSAHGPAAPTQHDRADCCLLCMGVGPALSGPVVALIPVPGGEASTRLTPPLAAPRLGMLARLPGGARAPPSRV
jgi:hypothetical protein